MTAQAFLALPETPVRIELIHGVVVYPFGYTAESEAGVSPAPEIAHQIVAGRVYALLLRLAPGGTALIAPVDVWLAADVTVQPDVLWLAPQSACQVEKRLLRGAPDLTVEVLSPSTARRDKTVKFLLYEQYGVREYWLADPERQTLEVWYLADGEYTLQGSYSAGQGFMSPVLGGVSVALADVFAV
jgi:Uma2 family endonuclease